MEEGEKKEQNKTKKKKKKVVVVVVVVGWGRVDGKLTTIDIAICV